MPVLWKWLQLELVTIYCLFSVVLSVWNVLLDIYCCSACSERLACGWVANYMAPHFCIQVTVGVTRWDTAFIFVALAILRSYFKLLQYKLQIVNILFYMLKVVNWLNCLCFAVVFFIVCLCTVIGAWHWLTDPYTSKVYVIHFLCRQLCNM